MSEQVSFRATLEQPYEKMFVEVYVVADLNFVDAPKTSTLSFKDEYGYSLHSTTDEIEEYVQRAKLGHNFCVFKGEVSLRQLISNDRKDVSTYDVVNITMLQENVTP